MARTKKTKAHPRPKEAPIRERSNPPAAEDDEGEDEDEVDPPMPLPEWTKRRARETVFKNYQSVAKGEEVIALLKKPVRSRDHWWGKVKVADAAGFTLSQPHHYGLDTPESTVSKEETLQWRRLLCVWVINPAEDRVDEGEGSVSLPDDQKAMSEKARKAQAGKNVRKRPCFVEETKKGTLVKKPATTRADRAASTTTHKDRVADVDARLQEYDLSVTRCQKHQQDCLRSSDRGAQGQARSLFAAAIVVVTYANRDEPEPDDPTVAPTPPVIPPPRKRISQKDVYLARQAALLQHYAAKVCRMQSQSLSHAHCPTPQPTCRVLFVWCLRPPIALCMFVCVQLCYTRCPQKQNALEGEANESHEKETRKQEKVGKVLIWAPCLVVSICVVFISVLCLSQGDEDQAQSDEKEGHKG